jgi:hypothetical protein
MSEEGVPSKALPNKIAQLRHKYEILLQRYLDMSVPWFVSRWVAFGVLLVLFMWRIIALQGFYIVAYALGIYLLNLLLLLLAPLSEPEKHDDAEPALPTHAGDEFKPFVPKMMEFRLWRKSTQGVLVSFVCTLSDVFDLPVFWPILLFYFILLVCLTMKQRIQHMMQHRYVPWSKGKPKYVSKDNK